MIKYEILKELIDTDFKKGRGSIVKKYNLTDAVARDYIAVLNNIKTIAELFETDKELIQENVRYKKQSQKYQDTNRIERKAFRENARVENAITEYLKELTEQNKRFATELSNIEVPKISKKSKGVAVIQISDWHLNELINLTHNKYDFQVASDRIKKFADECIKMCSAYEINNAVIAHTGDMLNSDRRLDELLNQATNRSKASVLSQYILTQFILHIRKHFKVHIVSVMGNESRMSDNWHNNNNIVSDNYDYTIFANVKQKFEFAKIKDVTFGAIDKMEQVIKVGEQNWLILHDVKKLTDKQKDVQSIIGKYGLQGIKIDYVLAGHIHATRITDLSARSASLAGSNEYNEHGLGLIGKASQNLFIVTKEGKRSIAIELQNTEYGSGYNVIKELEAYNTKSADKISKKVTIFEVKI